LASDAAEKEGQEVGQYLSRVQHKQQDFMKTNEVIDRGAFLQSFRKVLHSQQFSLVLGGKSLGKTLMRVQTVDELENEANARLTVIDVNMRAQPSKELFAAILGRIESKSSFLPAALQQVASTFSGLASAVAVGANPGLVAPAAATPISAGAKALVDLLTSSQRQKTLSQLVGKFREEGNATCILVDEANLALPAGQSPEDQQKAKQALQYFVMLTKEKKQAGVVLITSELGYPYRLQDCGMNLKDITNIIIVNEVPEEDMVRLMNHTWGMSQDLAKEFFSYFGGNIFVCCAAVEQLASKGSGFDPFCIVDCPGLPACAADADAKKHLQKMLDRGWSPVYDLDLDVAAKLIAEKNVGGIVPKRAKCCDLPDNVWDGDHEYALVPSDTLMRWKIGKELARRESMGSTGSAAPVQPTVIWACQLRKDGSTIEVAGNAFQVKGAIANVADLKDAIKEKKPKTVTCDADELDIYSQKDGRWVKEDEDNEVNRGTSKAHCYGFVLPPADDA